MAVRLKRSRGGEIVVALSLALLQLGQVEASIASAPARLGAPPMVTSSAPGSLAATIAPDLRHTLERVVPRAMIDLFVTLQDQVDLRHVPVPAGTGRLAVISTLRSTARSAQAGLHRTLARWRTMGYVRRIRPLWIVDAVAVRSQARFVEAIAATPGVAHVELDRSTAMPSSKPAGAPETGVNAIGAPTLWNLGLTGDGVVVANMDTGVDVNHPDLSGSWRGGTNSWFDPNGQHPAIPTDLSGHGTETMGIMVGRDAGGSTIGVAPDAQWIAAKIFNDAGSASTSGIHAAFQWMLDPDGNPLTDDAPDVVEGSWSMGSPGCDLTYEPDLQVLRAVGILPVFAAGNGGPSPGTSMSPGNNPSAFAVGAVDDADVISTISSRGPSTCGGSTEVFPDLVAPGKEVHTSDLFGTYIDASGTSMSAPHVAGGLALLLQAFPGSSPDDQGSALVATGLDLGVVGPDETYGNGRLDLAAAYAWLQASTPPSLPPLLSIRSDKARSIGGLVGVRDEDVLSFDGSSFAWMLDGSDIGLGVVDVDAVSRVDGNTFLLSFDRPITLTGVGVVDDSDIVRFVATSQGVDTAGSFSMELQGADVGLTTDAEDIDAIDVLATGEILVSTRGKGAVPAVPSFVDEDVLRFAPYRLGASTEGAFSMYFDGSDVGLNTTASEDVDAFVVGADGRVLLSTAGAFSVPGASGLGEDVVACIPSTLGSTTVCAFEAVPPFDGSAWGLAAGWGVDAYDAEGAS